MLEDLVYVIVANICAFLCQDAGCSFSTKDFLGAVLDHIEQLIFIRSCLCGNLRTALLNNKLVEAKLLCCTLKNLLFDRVFSNESVDNDLLSLANTMSSVHGLQISLGIPIAIVKHNNICTSEVDPQTSGSSCQ